MDNIEVDKKLVQDLEDIIGSFDEKKNNIMEVYNGIVGKLNEISLSLNK